MLIRVDCVRNWFVRFRILNWESVSIAGLRPRMLVLALSSRFLSEKNWRILRRNSSFLGQDSSMWRVFPMAAHPKRQLGSASGSILWLNALSQFCPEWSLCRRIATFLFAYWCHMMVPNLDLICMQLFLQVCWLRRRLVAQLALTIETISLGKGCC
jgi:hypothetical protein